MPVIEIFGGESVTCAPLPRQTARTLALAAAEGEHRLTADEAMLLMSSAHTLDLGAAATAMRERLHPDGEITFIVDRNVNYTNVCVSQVPVLRVLPRAR